MDEFRRIYEDVVQFPYPECGQLFRALPGGALGAQSEWSRRDVQRGELLRFVYKHVRVGDEWVTLVDDCAAKCLQRSRSRDGHWLATIKVARAAGKDCELLEVLDAHTGICVICENLTALRQHGAVRPDDNQFGSCRWSPTCTQLLYLADRFQPDAVSFFDSADAGRRGEQYAFEDNWGEQLPDAHHPTVCIYNRVRRVLAVCDWLPDDVSFGQAAWLGEDSVVVCGWLHRPYSLGLTYCSQRCSRIYVLDLIRSTYRGISTDADPLQSARLCPTPSPDCTQVLFLEIDSFEQHQSCCYLKVWRPTDESLRTVVDLVRAPKSVADFPGIHITDVPKLFWLSDNRHLLMNSLWRSEWLILLVDTETSVVRHLRTNSLPSSFNLFDVLDDHVLFAQESYSCPGVLMVAEVTKAMLLSAEHSCVFFDSCHTLLPRADLLPEWLSHVQLDVLQHRVAPQSLNANYPSVDSFDSLLVYRSDLPRSELKLCAFPHGGPHWVHPPSYCVVVVCLVQAGYAVLLVNYRGSLGFGQDSIDSLLGQVGKQDVADCEQAIDEVQKEFGLRAADGDVVLYGGSHGGYLALLMALSRPHAYRALVLRNAVTNLPTMLGVTDIHMLDWVVYEARAFQTSGPHGRKSTPFLFSYEALEQHYELMRTLSPITRAHELRARCLFLVGRDDLRVPNSQSVAMHKRLLAHGKPTRLLLYPDCHPLAAVPHEADCLLNMLCWFSDALCSP